MEKQKELIELLKSTYGYFLTRKEVAKELGVCPKTIMRFHKKGRLKAVVLSSRCYRYEASEVARFILDSSED